MTSKSNEPLHVKVAGEETAAKSVVREVPRNAAEDLICAPMYKETQNGPQTLENESARTSEPSNSALIVRTVVVEALLPVRPAPLDQNPAAVYLAGLALSSRRTMRASLNTIAALLTGNPETDALALDWAQVRFQHTAAVRSRPCRNLQPRQCLRPCAEP